MLMCNIWVLLNTRRPLAAVILVMVVVSELLAVVAAAHQVSPASSVTVIETPVIGTIAVSLPFTAGIRRSAASSAVIIPTRTPLTSYGNRNKIACLCHETNGELLPGGGSNGKGRCSAIITVCETQHNSRVTIILEVMLKNIDSMK